MSQETASLIIKVDSRGAESATRDLDKLNAGAGTRRCWQGQAVAVSVAGRSGRSERPAMDGGSRAKRVGAVLRATPRV